MTTLRSVGIFALIFIVCLIGYWDIASMGDSLKWDMIDCYYPWRSFVADCVRFKIFPLWNPYQHFGYPIFADLRSVFYPEPWVVGLLGGYTIKWFHGLFIFYLSFAGWGMSILAKNFSRQITSQVTVAVAYVMSGYFVGHAQDLGVLVSGAWIPWSLHYFLQLQKELRWKHVWLFTLFTYLHLTGGYHALNIIYVYLLVLIGIYALLQRDFVSERLAIVKQVRLNTAAGFLILLTVSSLIISYLQGSPHVARLSGLTLKEAYVGMLKPFSLSSLIVPFGATSWEGLAETDVSMSNVYVGLATLVFFLIGLWSKKPKALTVILIFGVICLLASLGPSTPVRKFLFDFVPGMNLFRMSSYFAFFAQLAIILTAAVGMDKVLLQPKTTIREFRWPYIVVLLVTIGLGFYAYTRWPVAGVIALENIFHLNAQNLDLDWNQRVVAHAAIQVMFLAFLVLSIGLLRQNRLLGRIGLLLVVVAEMTVSTKLNHPTTIGSSINPKEMQAGLNNLPQGFPIPDKKTPLRWIKDSHPSISVPAFYRNTNMMSRDISAEGYNSFKLSRFSRLKDDQHLLEQALRNPYVYGKSQQTKIDLSEFKPNTFQFLVNAPEADSITLQQTYFPGWHVSVNGITQKPTLALDAFPTVAVPQGTSTVVFSYENSEIITVFWCSVVVLAIIVSLIVYNGFVEVGWNPKKSGLGSLACLVLLISTFGFLNAQNDSYSEFKLKNYQELLEQISNVDNWERTELVVQVDDESLMDSLLREKGFKSDVTYSWRAGGSALKDVLDLNSERIIHAGWNEPKSQTLSLLLSQKLKSTSEVKITGGFITLYNQPTILQPLFERFTGFENEKGDSSSVRYSGLRSRVISNKQQGSSTLEFELSQSDLAERLVLTFKTMCLVPTAGIEKTSLFLQVQRKGEVLWEDGAGVHRLAKGYDGWFPAMLMAEPNIEMLPGDVLKAFVWGAGSNPIYLDDMHLAGYRLKAVCPE